MNEYVAEQLDQYRLLYEDYSQWLGALLRSCEETHKNDEWYQKLAALQKNMHGPQKKTTEKKASGKKSGKGKTETAAWVQAGDILLSSTEQGQAEVLFDAIEKIGDKIQNIEKFKAAVQQFERLGLGKNVNYIVYIEDDVPLKIVLRAKSKMPYDEVFKFAIELSVPAVYREFGNR